MHSWVLEACQADSLYKKEPLLDPNSYRMLAVRGTMYRM